MYPFPFFLSRARASQVLLDQF